MAGCCIYAEYPAKNRKRKTCVNMALQNKKKECRSTLSGGKFTYDFQVIGSSDTYSIISPGWQSNALHSLFIVPRVKPSSIGVFVADITFV